MINCPGRWLNKPISPQITWIGWSHDPERRRFRTPLPRDPRCVGLQWGCRVRVAILSGPLVAQASATEASELRRLRTRAGAETGVAERKSSSIDLDHRRRCTSSTGLRSPLPTIAALDGSSARPEPPSSGTGRSSSEVCTGVCSRRSSPTRLSQMNHSAKPNRLDLVTSKGAYGIRRGAQCCARSRDRGRFLPGATLLGA
jgi:hypothetical protein